MGQEWDKKDLGLSGALFFRGFVFWYQVTYHNGLTLYTVNSVNSVIAYFKYFYFILIIVFSGSGNVVNIYIKGEVN